MKKILIIFSLLFLTNCSYILKKIAGNFYGTPSDIQKVKKETSAFLEKSVKGLDPSRLFDIHLHVVGNGSGGTQIWINPEMKKGIHLFKRIQYQVYLHASGIKNENNADQEYLNRLIDLQQNMPFKMRSFILAFDKHYKPNGEVDLEESSFYIPNEYVYSLAKKYPENFIPAISVHPYRKDALDRLLYWAKKGVKLVKWLPNAMGMDPSDPKIKGYYEIMKKYNMVLLSHTGEEKAVDGEKFQKFGNPVLLKYPLDLGVKVIMAHMASLGNCENERKELESCFHISLRMLDDPKYKDNLYADISALTIHDRSPFLEYILDRQDLHSRLIYGSDYPLPAINLIFRTKKLVELGYITTKEQTYINEIYSYNPLLFDFVLKRALKHPKSQKKFLDEAFYLPKELMYLSQF